jgi:hypothetical protein
MKRSLQLCIFPLIVSLVFAGCSPGDLFAKLAGSQEELGASEAFNKSKVVEAKQQKIEQMKQSIPDFAVLSNVTEAIQGFGTAFRKTSPTTTDLSVEVMIPDPDRELYEVWVSDPTGKTKKRLGALMYNQAEDYSFTYSGGPELVSFPIITISKEAVPDDIMEKPVMTGQFKTESGSPQP